VHGASVAGNSGFDNPILCADGPAVTTTDPTVAAQVENLQAQMADHLPAAVLDAFGAEQAELRAAGDPETAAVGTAPDADLLDVHGRPTTLTAARAGRPAVVVFYRGGWCPYCNIALRTYQAQLVPQLRERGVELVAVSPQKPDGSLSTQEAAELTFTVLSDPGNVLARQLGIRTEPTADTLAAQQSLGLDLTAANADGTAEIPMPTTLVLNAQGVVRWIDVHADYTTRSEVADILAAVDAP
jgi:peroxiredoxin